MIYVISTVLSQELSTVRDPGNDVLLTLTPKRDREEELQTGKTLTMFCKSTVCDSTVQRTVQYSTYSTQYYTKLN